MEVWLILQNKTQFLASCINSTIWIYHIDADEANREEAGRELHQNATSYTEQIHEAKSHETPAVRLPTSYLKNHSSKTNKICRTLLEKQGRTHK